MEQPRNPENKEEIKGMGKGVWIYCAVMLAITTIPGVILWIVNHNPIYLESFYVAGGCLDLIVWLWRPRARENAHYRKEKTLVESHSTKEYKRFASQQVVILLFGLALLAASLLVFLIRRFN